MYHPPRVRQKQLFSGMHSLGSVMQTINIQIIIPNIYMSSQWQLQVSNSLENISHSYRSRRAGSCLATISCEFARWVFICCVYLHHTAKMPPILHWFIVFISSWTMAKWKPLDKHLSGHSVCKHRLGTKYPAYKSLPMHKACLTCFFLPWTINVQFRIHPHLHINKTRNLISHHFRFICSTSLFTTVIQKWNKPVSKTSTFRKKKNK